jgi:hypothetical protein
MPESREWIVTIGGRIEEATDNQVFLTLFEVALTSDPAARIIQFNEPTWPHTTSAVVQISAVNEKAAEAVGLDIPTESLHSPSSVTGITAGRLVATAEPLHSAFDLIR